MCLILFDIRHIVFYNIINFRHNVPKINILLGEKIMKEYKTIKVTPAEEVVAIQYHETFGWKLEETREVYNESQEILGMKEKVTPYNSFMQGFTGNSGKVESQVRTRTNVTHFLSIRFSRETTMKNYSRLSELQNEFENLTYEPHHDLPKKPILLTVLGLFGFISIILPLGAIFSWISYFIKKKKFIALNEQADKKNSLTAKRDNEIIEEARKLIEESKVA